MVKIEKVTPGMAGHVLDLLMEFRAGHLTRDIWSRVLTYNWGQREDYQGLALMDDGKMVGFLGMIFSERTLGGVRRGFCSLVAWIVLPEYRNHSLSLLAPLLQMKDYTITNLTSFPGGVEIMRRIGFDVLDSESMMVFAVPTLSPGGGWSVTQDPDNLRRVLAGPDRKIFEDHQPYSCQHLLVHSEAGDYCYAVFTERSRIGLKYWFAHYISQPGLFFNHLARIRNYLLRRGVVMFLIDSRYTGNQRPLFAHRRRLSVSRLYRPSEGIAPIHVDTLYSEWTILHR